MARGGRRRGPAAEQENEERWLLTYADMLTLMFALFMVLFSISSVNISKYQTLQESLKAAFSGSILTGGKAIRQSGSESTSAHTPATAEVPAIVAPTPNASASASQEGSAQQASTQQVSAQGIAAAMAAVAAANAEQKDFIELKQRLDDYAKAHGFSNQVQTIIDKRGLVVRVLTDQLLFDSGQAALKPAGLPLLDEVAQLLNVDRTHPITVEGHTDNQPIASAEFPSNWDLSTARADTVLRFLTAHGVTPQRLAAAGYADMRPVAGNDTAAGRARNRRVEIVLQRLDPFPTSNSQ